MRGDHSELLAPAWQDRLASFQPYIEAAKKTDSTAPLWSTYSSLYERENDIIHPSSSGCDYIIHCLGGARDQYTRDFIDDKPELTTTLRPSYFVFEEWLWGRHADFYTSLVEDYSIVSDNSSHMLWKRDSQASKHLIKSEPLSVNHSTHAITLPTANSAGSRVIEVTVHYETDKLYGKLPLLNKMPRYILRPHGTTSTIAFSLPPNKHVWNFLVVLDDKNTYEPYLIYDARGLLPRADMNISSATYSPVSIDDRELAYFTEQFIPAKE